MTRSTVENPLVWVTLKRCIEAMKASETSGHLTARSATLQDRMGNAMDAFTLGMLAVAQSAHPVKAQNFFLHKGYSDSLSGTMTFVHLEAYSLMSLLPISSLRGITALSLHIGAGDLGLENELCVPLECVFPSIECLERLECSFQCYDHSLIQMSQVSDRIYAWLNRARLNHLTLYRLAVERSALQKLLVSHRSSLRSLEMLEVALTGGNCWLDMLAWIADFMALDSFRSYLMTQDDGELFEVDQDGWEDYRFTCTEIIRQA